MSQGFFRQTAWTLLALATVACSSTAAYDGMTPEQILGLAQRKMAEDDPGDAAEALEQFLLRYPNHPGSADVRYQLAELYYEDEKYITAQQAYSEFLVRHPRDERAPEASLGVCRSFVGLSPHYQRDPTPTEEAVLICQGVVNDYTGIDDEVAEQAREYVTQMRSKLGRKKYETAQQYLDLEALDSAIIYYQMVVDEYGDTEWAPKAMLGLIEVYEELGYEEEIETWRQRLLNSYPDSPEAKSINGADASGSGG